LVIFKDLGILNRFDEYSVYLHIYCSHYNKLYFLLPTSERLKQDTTVLLDNDVDDIPIIPELDDFTEDDLATQVAAPPRSNN